MFKISVQFLIAGLLALPGLSAAAGSVKFPATSQTACFDQNGDPRACSGSGEDGDKLVGVALPTTARYTDNKNGTVADNLTGLIWSQHANAPSRANGCLNAESEMTWLQALDFVACLNTKSHAGFSDWRLPNLNELESMVNSGVADTSAYLNANGFGIPGQPSSQVQSGRYWSSTTDASALASQSADAAWDVDLVKGGSPFSTLKNDQEFLSRSVWPVRGKMSATALLPTGLSLCFDEIGDSRTCKDTGEDSEKQEVAVTTTQRFKSNYDATIAGDKLSGLIWTTDTQTPGPAACDDTGYDLNWQEALDHVACLNAQAFLGHSDWRLPNRKELRSLADYSTGAPALTAGHPFVDQAGAGSKFWSSTTDLSSPTEAWTISLFDGSLSSAVKSQGILPVLPVRGPVLNPPALSINQGNMTTKVASQTISGTVGADATIQVAIDGVMLAAPPVVGTTWSFTTPPLTKGANSITVAAADVSGNTNSAAIIITLDNVLPALSINPVAARTNKKIHTIGGTAEAGATVAVTTGGQTVIVPVTNNTWSFPVAALATGANTFVVTATDAVGNVSPQAVTINFAAPDGIVTGGSVASIGDALKTLRIAVGIVQASSDDLLRGDVAPPGAPDDKIDVSDVVLILKKAVGMASF
jgi:hypothetical protein